MIRSGGYVLVNTGTVPMFTQSEKKGGKLYYDVKKELINRNVNLEKVFNERLRFYESYYK